MLTKTSLGRWWPLASLLAVALAFLPATAIAGDGEEPQNELPEIFRGLLIAMGNVSTGANTSLNMHITDWTTPTQRQVLMNALQQGTEGESSLFNLVRNSPEKGFLQVRSQVGPTRLKYAWQSELPDGKRRITLIADRLLPIIFADQLNEDTYTIIFLDVDADGTGTAAIGATIRWDEEAQRIMIGVPSTEPLRMTSVRKVQ